MCFLLDVALLDSLFIQVLDELFPLHPVDVWADVTAVAKKRSASQVERTSCKMNKTKRIIKKRRCAVIFENPVVLLKVRVSAQSGEKKNCSSTMKVSNFNMEAS